MAVLMLPGSRSTIEAYKKQRRRRWPLDFTAHQKCACAGWREREREKKWSENLPEDCDPWCTTRYASWSRAEISLWPQETSSEPVIQQILAWAHLWRPSPPMNPLPQAFLFLFFSFLPFFLSVCVSVLIPHQFLLRNDLLAHGRRMLSPYFKLPQNLTSSRKRISLYSNKRGICTIQATTQQTSNSKATHNTKCSELKITKKRSGSLAGTILKIMHRWRSKPGKLYCKRTR